VAITPLRKTGSSVGEQTPEITGGDNLTGVSVRAALSKLIRSGVTGGDHSIPENRIVGRRTDSGDYRQR
jgi:hypothetical protein